MNDLQKCELNILKEFIRICEILEIKYYLVCGSALGAVKYKGFIPWDDDIDVALLRKDYELFCEKAGSILKEGYFLQNYKTEKYYPFLFSKIRDCNTTCIERIVSEIDMNHGVYIDVFPLDGYPSNDKDKAEIEKIKRIAERRRSVRMNYPRLGRGYWTAVRTNIVYVLFKVFGYCRDTNRVIKQLDEKVSSYQCETSDIWCNHGNWQGKLEYAPKEQYGGGTWAEFEDLKVRIPEDYNAYLSQKYGEWEKDPPVEKQRSHHHFMKFDLDRPYTYYTNKDNNNTK